MSNPVSIRPFAGPFGIVCLTALIAFSAGASQERKNRVLTAESFVLQGSDGKTRARLGPNIHDQPSLSLLHADGTERLILELSAKGAPLLTLMDSQSKPRVQIGVSPDDHPAIVVSDPEMRRFVRIATEISPIRGVMVPQIHLFDSTMTGRLSISIEEKDRPSITLFDKAGKPVIEIGNNAVTGEPQVKINKE